MFYNEHRRALQDLHFHIKFGESRTNLTCVKRLQHESLGRGRRNFAAAPANRCKANICTQTNEHSAIVTLKDNLYLHLEQAENKICLFNCVSVKGIS